MDTEARSAEEIARSLTAEQKADIRDGNCWSGSAFCLCETKHSAALSGLLFRRSILGPLRLTELGIEVRSILNRERA